MNYLVPYICSEVYHNWDRSATIRPFIIFTLQPYTISSFYWIVYPLISHSCTAGITLIIATSLIRKCLSDTTFPSTIKQSLGALLSWTHLSLQIKSPAPCQETRPEQTTAPIRRLRLLKIEAQAVGLEDITIFSADLP